MNTYLPVLLRFSFQLIIFTLYVIPVQAQLVSILPNVDSINIVGSCTPAEIICHVSNHIFNNDTVTIRSLSIYGDPICTGFPPNQANTIPALKFIIPDTANRCSYQLWLRPTEFSDGPIGRLIFDTTYRLSRQLYFLVLYVFSGDTLVDSAKIKFRSITTGLFVNESNNSNPNLVTLKQNYPNPFNPSTIISFFLPSQCFVSIKVYDLMGKEVSSVVSKILSAGNHSIPWNANGLPSGIYLYRIQSGSFVQTKKICLLK